MSLKDFIGRGVERIGAFIRRVRVGGFTVPSILKRNRDNTKASLLDSFRSAVLGGVDDAAYSQSLEQIIKRRKRAALTTLKNTFSAVRGEARAEQAAGRSGIWSNSSILDGRTTQICMEHVGATWRLPYSQIPNKPPRIPPSHPCRSILVFRGDDVEYVEELPFIDQFNGNPELQRELLGPKRFEAFRSGSLQVNSFADFEKSVLNTLDDLGLGANRTTRAPIPAETKDFLDKSKPYTKIDKPKTENTTVPDSAVSGEPKPDQRKLSLSSEEVGEIEYYKGDGFYRDNQALLNPDDFDSEVVKNAKAHADRLDKIISKSLTTKDHLFYRGVRSKELFDNAEKLIGKSLQNRTVQSTTFKESVARNYAGLLGELSGESGKSILFKIRVKKGSAALNPADHTSINSAEFEVMLKGNSTYNVTGVIDKGQYKIIEVDYDGF